ncbi:MAG: allophanate hydrolase subunit 1 [Pseudonocardia sp.]|nr:allophanate hydrolase subunit 1 [Pseudonocardia sp.]
MAAVRPRVRACGRWALLLELDSAEEVAATARTLRAAALPEVVELVPAARTVLVEVLAGTGLDRVRDAVSEVDPSAAGADEGARHTIPVVYDGEDLQLVADTAGIGTDEVVALHTGAEFTVAFCGFAPGFGYLSGLPEQLCQPRLASPRSAVPSGSVGLADVYSCVYPRRSPGGWRLIGRTDLTMFDAAADPPARLAPGDRVRFEAQ